MFAYLFVFFFFFSIKKGKFWKIQKQCVYVYIGTYVTLHGNKISLLCIFCSLDEHLHAQLSNASFVTRYVICMIWLIFYHSYLYHFFWRERLKKS